MANKRKTVTSSEVKRRWIVANYRPYTVNLRYDTDTELIDFVEKVRTEENIGVTEVFRNAIAQYMQVYGKCDK